MTKYMHTLDGKPAYYGTYHYNTGSVCHYLALASNGHHSRRVRLADSLRQIRNEQQACIRTAWKEWHDDYNRAVQAGREPQPAPHDVHKRFDYVLVEVLS